MLLSSSHPVGRQPYQPPWRPTQKMVVISLDQHMCPSYLQVTQNNISRNNLSIQQFNGTHGLVLIAGLQHCIFYC